MAFTNYKEEYSSIVDEVLVSSGTTAPFIVPGVEFLSGRSVKYPKLSFGPNSVVDYDRFSTETAFTYEYETRTLANDKQGQFYIDWADANDFPLSDAAFTSSEWIRTQLTPLMEANFYKKLAQGAANSVTTAPTAGNIVSQLDVGIKTLGQVGITAGTLFMSWDAKQLLEGNMTREYGNDGAVSKLLQGYNGYSVVPVPDTVLGGAAAGSVRWALVAPGSIMDIRKRSVTYTFAPGTHTKGDGWLIQSRYIYDAVVLDNAAAGIYVNKVA